MRLAKELTFALLIHQRKGSVRCGKEIYVWQYKVAAQQLFASLLLSVDEARVECEQFAG